MITEHVKFQLPDIKKNHHLRAEVNWKPDDPLTNESKVIKFVLSDGSECLVKREDLNNVLFAIGKPEDQRGLIPKTLQTVHWRRTILSVKATKDIHKGEEITFPIEISFPCTNVKTIVGEETWKKDVLREQKKDKFAIPGKIIT